MASISLGGNPSRLPTREMKRIMDDWYLWLGPLFLFKNSKFLNNNKKFELTAEFFQIVNPSIRSIADVNRKASLVCCCYYYEKYLIIRQKNISSCVCVCLTGSLVIFAPPEQTRLFVRVGGRTMMDVHVTSRLLSTLSTVSFFEIFGGNGFVSRGVYVLKNWPRSL